MFDYCEIMDEHINSVQELKKLKVEVKKFRESLIFILNNHLVNGDEIYNRNQSDDDFSNCKSPEKLQEQLLYDSPAIKFAIDLNYIYDNNESIEKFLDGLMYSDNDTYKRGDLFQLQFLLNRESGESELKRKADVMSDDDDDDHEDDHEDDHDDDDDETDQLNNPSGLPQVTYNSSNYVLSVEKFKTLPVIEYDKLKYMDKQRFQFIGEIFIRSIIANNLKAFENFNANELKRIFKYLVHSNNLVKGFAIIFKIKIDDPTDDINDDEDNKKIINSIREKYIRFQSIIGFIINNNFKNFKIFENLFHNLIKFEIKDYLRINFESIIKLSSLRFNMKINYKEKVISNFKPYKIQFLNILFNQIFKETLTILIIKDLNIIIGIGNGINLKSSEIYAYINTLKNRDKIFKFIENFKKLVNLKNADKKNKKSNQRVIEESDVILSVDDIFEYGDFVGVEKVIKNSYFKKLIRDQLNEYLQNKEENPDKEIDYDNEGEENESDEIDDEITIDSNEDYENKIRNMNINDEEFIEEKWNIKTDLKNDCLISANENKYKIEFYDDTKKSIILKNVLYKGPVNINAKNKFYGIFNKFGLNGKYKDYLTKSGYYLSECEVNGKIFGIGLAPSKKIAQQRAAMRSIEMLKILRGQNLKKIVN